MKNQFKAGIFAGFLVLGINSAIAQTPVQWTRTLQFDGNWSGLAELNLGGQVFNVDYHTDFHTAVDGNAMSMDEGFSDPNLGEFKGANLIGYSPYDDQIHWFSVDNFGTAHEHTGTWLNPRHFQMEHHSIQGGLPFAEYIDFKLRANNQRIAVSVVAILGPDTVETISGILYKQSNGNRIGSPDNADVKDIVVYPNPGNGNFFIESNEVIDKISVMNEIGQIVSESKPLETEYELQLQETGIYFVRVTCGANTVTEKLIIQK